MKLRDIDIWCVLCLLFCSRVDFKHMGNGQTCLGTLLDNSTILILIVWARQKKHINHPPKEQFSLTFYLCRLYKFQKLFSKTIGTFLFFVPVSFLWFFSLKLIGPRRNLVWLGGAKMSVFHSLSNLLFKWIPFHKNWFLHKIDSMHFGAQGANDSKSLFIIPKFDLHVDIQLLKVRKKQELLSFTVGHVRTLRHY